MHRPFLAYAASAFALALLSQPAGAAEFDLAEIDQRARRLASQSGVVGMAVAVIDDGEIVFAQGYGRTVNGRNARMVDEDTVFRWASVSKSVAAATALSLAEDGYFALDTPVEAFVDPALPSTDEPITLEHILSHQAGVTRNAYDTKIEDGQSAARVKGNLQKLTVLCAPGTCHSYQNVTYDLSRDMIETATGLPYRAVVNERVFEPLGMDTASVSHEGLTTSANWARPHNSGGRQYNFVKPTYYRIPAAAGVNSSVSDLARWVVANMDGQGVADAVADDMQTPRISTPRRSRMMRRRYPFMRDARYGLGWRSFDYSGGGRVISHRGAVQGYRASVMFDPATRDGVAVLWNSNSSRPNGLVYEVMDQSYGLPKKDWLKMSPRRRTVRTVRRAKPRPAKPKPVKPQPAKPQPAKPVPAPATEPAALTSADIDKLVEAENERLLEDALAATCPCPGDDDGDLSGNQP